MLWYLYLAAVVVATCLHLWLGKRPVSAKRVAEVLLLYLLVIFVGLGGLMGFLGHTFKAREIALKIGWQPSPFQFEVAVANLAFGVWASCASGSGDSGRPPASGVLVFLLGCGYGHLRDMKHGNFTRITSDRCSGSMTGRSRGYSAFALVRRYLASTG
jgi:hypothetical protein